MNQSERIARNYLAFEYQEYGWDVMADAIRKGQSDEKTRLALKAIEKAIFHDHDKEKVMRYRKKSDG